METGLLFSSSLVLRGVGASFLRSGSRTTLGCSGFSGSFGGDGVLDSGNAAPNRSTKLLIRAFGRGSELFEGRADSFGEDFVVETVVGEIDVAGDGIGLTIDAGARVGAGATVRTGSVHVDGTSGKTGSTLGVDTGSSSSSDD